MKRRRAWYGEIMRLRSSGRAVTVAAALVVVLAACGSDNSASSSVVTTATTVPTTATTTAAGNAALCSARASLKSSIQDLAKVDVVKSGTSGLQDALTKVKENLQAVKSSANADLQPQVTAVQNAVDQLSTALSNASSVGVAGVATAAKNVATAGSTLITSLDNLKCS
jgi:hypothetical protein